MIKINSAGKVLASCFIDDGTNVYGAVARARNRHGAVCLLSDAACLETPRLQSPRSHQRTASDE